MDKSIVKFILQNIFIISTIEIFFSFILQYRTWVYLKTT